MSTRGHSDWKGFWAILWRSVAFMPYMLGVFVGVGTIWLSRWVLPIWAALFLCSHDWWFTSGTLAVWFLAVWSYRRFRLSCFLEPPPSLL